VHRPGTEPDAPAFERLLDAVLRRIDRGELICFTGELVRIPSVYRPEEAEGNEARVARILAGYLEREGFEVHTEEVAPGRPNVWALREGDRPGRTLLFEGHTDVVTEGRAEDWSHPPFGAERVGGRIYGRGACDTKGNVAAAVMAVRAIRDSDVSFPGRLVLCHPASPTRSWSDVSQRGSQL
jgi:succinyl-diaminopimelate desuccinylase